jgi:hypothetical protein
MANIQKVKVQVKVDYVEARLVDVLVDGKSIEFEGAQLYWNTDGEIDWLALQIPRQYLDILARVV